MGTNSMYEEYIMSLESEKEMLVRALITIRTLAEKDIKAQLPERCVFDPYIVAAICTDVVRKVSDRK